MLPSRFKNRSAVTKQEYAELFDISVRTVDRLIKKKAIPVVDENKVGNAVRIPCSFLKKNLRHRTTPNDTEEPASIYI